MKKEEDEVSSQQHPVTLITETNCFRSMKENQLEYQQPCSFPPASDLLFGKMMAVSCVRQMIFHYPEHRLSPIGAVIWSALTRLVNEKKDNSKP